MTPAIKPVPRWVHAMAILTVIAAAPLFFLGADVTTKGVGMADSRPVVHPAQALHEYSTAERSHGWKIEHAHRLAGWFIGLCGIVLCVSLWLTEPRPWVRWLGTLALAFIVLQGLIGIFRVHLHALVGPDLAWMHGAFAQIVLATLVSVAVVTSSLWTMFSPPLYSGGAGGGEGHRRDSPPLTPPEYRGGEDRRLALITCGVIYLQLVLGGMVRHRDFFLGARLHLLTAFAVAGLTLWLFVRLREQPMPGTRIASWLLIGCLALQLVLGVEAWLCRFSAPTLPYNQIQPLDFQPTLIRTLHFIGGSLLFATCVTITLNLYRCLIPAKAGALSTAGEPCTEPVTPELEAVV